MHTMENNGNPPRQKLKKTRNTDLSADLDAGHETDFKLPHASGPEEETLRKYGDIIDLPHHQSNRHHHMTMEARAAQFAPFAALTGYEDSIREAGRYVSTRPEKSEEFMQALYHKIRELAAQLDRHPMVTVVWFREDRRKSGGSFRTYTGIPKKISSQSKDILMQDGFSVPFSSIEELDWEFPKP